MFALRVGGVLAILLLICVAGCSESGPNVEYVEGTVKLDGQPIADVTVAFSPTGEGGVGAVGTTNAEGVYKMTAVPNGAVDQGAMAGDYNVTLQKSVTEQGTSSPKAGEKGYGEPTAAPKVAPSAPKSTHIIPQKYNVPTTSGLKVTVKSGTNKGPEFNFDIKKE